MLLWVFPKPFRDRLGRSLVQTLLTDSRTAAGRLAMGRFVTGAIDVVVAGLAERFTGSRPPRRPKRQRRLDLLWHDLRYSVRRLLHARGFAAAAIVTFAAAIGINTAIFQLLDAVRLRALPIASPSELAEIRLTTSEGSRGNVSVWHAGATNAIWEQVRARQEAFSGVFAWSSGGLRLAGPTDEPRFASALLVSGEFFDVLGLRPALGRLLTRGDDIRGCSAPGVVLSHAFWQIEFGGDRSVVGRTIALGQASYTVTGVTPREFTGLEVGRRFDVAIPLCAESLPPGSFSRLDSGVEWFLIVMGRLKPGWTLDRAATHLASISPAVFRGSLPANYPADAVDEYLSFQLTALDASRGISLLRDEYTTALWSLQATAVLMLIVGCTNVAALMLARATSRDREVAARMALGASRGRILTLLLTEALVLSVAGGALGAWFARRLSVGLVQFLDGGSNSLFLQMPMDWRVFSVGAVAAVFTSVVCGIAPAWRAARVPPELVLRAGGRSLTDAGGRRLRQALLMAQIGLSFVLLSGALLFTRSLGRLASQDLGLSPDGMTIAYVNMSGVQIPVDRRAAFRRDLLRRIAGTPGVIAATETSVVPLSGSASDNEVWIDGARNGRALSFFMETSGTYFATLGMPLVAGRTFDDGRDTPVSAPVAVVNEEFARRFLGGANPVGRRFWREQRPDAPETRYEIVGLVKDAKYQNLRQEFRPTVYVPKSQDPSPGTFAQMLIRTSMPAGTAAATLKRAFARASAGIVPTFQDFRAMIDRSLVQDQMLAGLSVVFGALAALLAAVGLYGSISFTIANRTKEIGLRIALGADRRSILLMVLREAARPVVAGCVAGAILTFWLAPIVETLLYQLEPNDPTSRLTAALLLAGIALAASIVPARRAAGLDPIAACRAE
jgi:predicted permease